MKTGANIRLAGSVHKSAHKDTCKASKSPNSIKNTGPKNPSKPSTGKAWIENGDLIYYTIYSDSLIICDFDGKNLPIFFFEI